MDCPGIVGQLNQMMGIQITYAITTNFPGFIAMVDEMGGLDVNVPEALNDSYSGAMFQPGLQHLTGDQALAPRPATATTTRTATSPAPRTRRS